MAEAKGQKMGVSKLPGANGANNSDNANSSVDTIPTLSADALASLTARIEQGFKGGAGVSKTAPKKGKGKGDQAPPKKDKGNEGGKASKNKGTDKKAATNGRDANKAKPPKNEKGDESKAAQKAKGDQTKNIRKDKTPNEPQAKHHDSMSDANKPNSTPKTKKGKKRDHYGKVIGSQGQDEPAGNGNNKQLEDAIYSVRGTKEDYDLLAGVESESEVEMEGGHDDSSLRKDIERMLKGEEPRDEKKSNSKKGLEAAVSKEERKKGPADKLASKAEEEKKEKNGASAKKAQPSAKEAKKEKQKGADTKAQASTQKEKKEPKTKSKFIIEPRPDWHATPLSPIDSLPRSVPSDLLQRIHTHATSLLNAENEIYSHSNTTSAGHQFYSSIASTGTLSDRVSALTLAITESPLHNMHALTSLIALARKRSRAQAVEVLRSIKDLFAHGAVLPSDRRLRGFARQPELSVFGNGWTTRDPLPDGIETAHLVMWAFEDFLKEQYFEVLKILEVWCNDEIEFARSRALSYVWELLKEKPEQEANLLRLLVNKLGDRGRKIASRASFLLLQLEQAHPRMKPMVISAIEADVLFRPGQSAHAKYYAAVTLNQTVLSRAEAATAGKLLDIYFALFVQLLKQDKDQKKDGGPKKGDKGKKGGKKDGKKGADKKDTTPVPPEDLREKLIAALLSGVNRAYPFAGADSPKLASHLDTLFSITHSANFNTGVQALMLIQQLLATGAGAAATNRFYRTLYESVLDGRVVVSSKQALYLNLLYRSLMAEASAAAGSGTGGSSGRRLRAFVKRLVQALTLHGPPFAIGVFALLRELEKACPSVTAMVDEAEPREDEDREVFRDVPDEEDEPQEVQKGTEPSEAKPRVGQYDPRKRDPEYANADKACLWELLPYTIHYHPTIAVTATQLFTHAPISSKPDLTLHTLMHFLDRFVYRNPKAAPPLRGASIMQPLAGGDSDSRLVTTTAGAAGGAATGTLDSVPVNSEAFWKKAAADVPAEDIFFHAYFNRLGEDRRRREKKTKKGRKDGAGDGSDDDSEGGDEDEDEIWQALVQSRPEIEGDDELDDEDGLDEEFAEAMESDDDDGLDGEGDDDLDDDPDGDVEINEDDDPSDNEQAADADADGGEGDDMAMQLDDSDDDALIGSDAEVDLPPTLVGMDNDKDGDDDDDGTAEGAKRGKKDVQKKREKRRKLRHLPTFAAAEDYEALLAGEDEGM